MEAGAQGQHKIARGYLPTAVYSAHYIADPALRAPVARFLTRSGARCRARWTGWPRSTRLSGRRRRDLSRLAACG